MLVAGLSDGEAIFVPDDKFFAASVQCVDEVRSFISVGQLGIAVFLSCLGQIVLSAGEIGD